MLLPNFSPKNKPIKKPKINLKSAAVITFTSSCANFVEAIGSWIVGQAEKWNAIRSCYETSTSENKRVLFLCIGSSEQAEFEKWRELDKQILKLANEVEGISTS